MTYSFYLGGHAIVEISRNLLKKYIVFLLDGCKRDTESFLKCNFDRSNMTSWLPNYIYEKEKKSERRQEEVFNLWKSLLSRETHDARNTINTFDSSLHKIIIKNDYKDQT